MITLPVHQLPCRENKSLVVSFAWAIYLQKEELVLPRSLLVIAAGSARAVCAQQQGCRDLPSAGLTEGGTGWLF